MLRRIIAQPHICKFISHCLGVRSVNYSKIQFTPEHMLMRSQVFLHACQTPLTVMQCCVDVLDKNQNKPVEPEVISGLKASTEELRHLVFEAGNKSSNESDLFSLNCVANSVITMIKWRFPKSSIQCEIEPGIMIKGNRLYFEEALRCVATNAIEAYSSKNSPRHLSLLARKRRNQIQIDVVDLGSGISDSARRFALLGGVSYKNRGSGIGLGFCKYTIEKVFHGKMTISSQGGIGTRVTWHLPLN